MKRRDFFATIGVAAIALSLRVKALAQARSVHIGFLATVAPTPDMLNALRLGLRERGYIEGQNLSINGEQPGQKSHLRGIQALRLTSSAAMSM